MLVKASLSGEDAVVACGHQGPGLALFGDLALDEVGDVGMVDVEDDHLGGAAGLAAGLDDAGEGVEAAHEGERAGGGAAAAEGFHAAADLGEVGACAGAPLEEHALGLGEREDRVEGVVDGVDEAGGALRAGVAGLGEDGVILVGVPVPVVGVGVGLEAVAADVEPDGRVEGGLLVEEQVAELGEEDLGVVGGGEVAVADAPVADGFGDAGDEGADAGLTFGGADLAVEVLGGDDVGRGHGPGGGRLDVLLLEDDLALEVLDDGVALFPGELVEGGDAGLGEVAGEFQAAGALQAGVGGGLGGGLGGGSGSGGVGDDIGHGETSHRAEMAAAKGLRS